ncbi:hypothetical protein ACHAXM_009256, partial [Skeletonema potamos]
LESFDIGIIQVCITRPRYSQCILIGGVNISRSRRMGGPSQPSFGRHRFYKFTGAHCPVLGRHSHIRRNSQMFCHMYCT